MNLFDQAKRYLLDPVGLTPAEIEAVFASLQAKRPDFADIYLQYSHFESWLLEDGIVKRGGHSLDLGFGIRAVIGEKSGFAYGDAIDLKALQEAAKNAATIVHYGQSGGMEVPTKEVLSRPLYPALDPLATLTTGEKIGLLQRLDRLARSRDPRISQVMISLACDFEAILILNERGWHADLRPLVRLNVTVIMDQNGRRESGSTGGGGRVGLDFFFQENRAEAYVEEAIRQAQVNLEAEEAPAGVMEVVLGNGWPGILLHEAVGHGLEGDFNRKGVSAFSGKIGQRVASPLCTVVDDGTLEGRRGSLQIDDEGTPTQCTVLIEKGVLKGYMQDQLNARLMKMPLTGNGRRESYAHLPLPRMTNTYLLPGEHAPEEIIASVKRGVYAKNFGGGQVDITSGKFVFSASEAHLIENGRLTKPLKGMTLIGHGPEVLKKVVMVGNDLKLDPGIGTCGKEGQSVPVGVGQPTLKVSALTVGGTKPV